MASAARHGPRPSPATPPAQRRAPSWTSTSTPAASFDSLASPESHASGAASARGLTHLAITDHDTIDGALAARRRRRARWRPTSRSSSARRSRPLDGDLIAVFLERGDPERARRPTRRSPRVRAQGGLVGIPHPFDRFRGSLLRDARMERIVDAGRLGRGPQRPDHGRRRQRAGGGVRPRATACRGSPCPTRTPRSRSASRTPCSTATLRLPTGLLAALPRGRAGHRPGDVLRPACDAGREARPAGPRPRPASPTGGTKAPAVSATSRPRRQERRRRERRSGDDRRQARSSTAADAARAPTAAPAPTAVAATGASSGAARYVAERRAPHAGHRRRAPHRQRPAPATTADRASRSRPTQLSLGRRMRQPRTIISLILPIFLLILFAGRCPGSTSTSCRR